MNRKALSDWIKSEVEQTGSYRQLALSLGTSTTTLNALRDELRGSVSGDLLRAIALRRQESAEDTAKWLGVEPPDSFDWPAKFANMEARLKATERKVESLYQQMADSNEFDPNLTLNSYLLERGISVRSSITQAQIRGYVETAAPDIPGAFERFLLIVLGVLPAASADLFFVSQVLKQLSDDPWTPQEVKRVLKIQE